MLISKFAKSREVLMSAPRPVQVAMSNMILYREAEVELRADIAERFDYPSLWAAIDRLMYFVEQRAKAEQEVFDANFTYDDSFALCEYTSQGDV